MQTKEIIAYILPTGGQAGARSPAAHTAAMAGAATVLSCHHQRERSSKLGFQGFLYSAQERKIQFCMKHWETLALLWHLGVWALRVSGKRLVSHDLKLNAALASCISWTAVPGTCCSDLVVASQTWTGAADHGLKVLGDVICRLISAGKREETSAGVKKYKLQKFQLT